MHPDGHPSPCDLDPYTWLERYIAACCKSAKLTGRSHRQADAHAQVALRMLRELRDASGSGYTTLRSRSPCEQALDDIASMCNCATWDYAGQVVRDVAGCLAGLWEPNHEDERLKNALAARSTP